MKTLTLCFLKMCSGFYMSKSTMHAVLPDNTSVRCMPWQKSEVCLGCTKTVLAMPRQINRPTLDCILQAHRSPPTMQL